MATENERDQSHSTAPAPAPPGAPGITRDARRSLVTPRASVEALLALENGRVFRGRSFGARGTSAGEVVFNTSLTGYQEVLTDPSYRGQIVAMTAPQIGNTGVNDEDEESTGVWLSGFIVRELSPVASSWRARGDLHGYLESRGVVGMEGIDVRALTRELRATGSLRGIVCSEGASAEDLVRRARESPGLEGRALVSEVTAAARSTWTQDGAPWLARTPAAAAAAASGAKALHRVVAFDYGIKRGILRRLVDHGADLTVVPAGTTAAEVLALRPDGVFLSNGPGDPGALPAIAGEVKALLGQVPIFGICLGHQILGLALGAKTFKLRFGHHGGNHPVSSTLTARVEITTQNHGFAVDPETLPAGAEPTHWNLNDGTLEGFRHRAHGVLAVQYHPEAEPGPHDSHYLFEEFKSLMDERKNAASR